MVSWDFLIDEAALASVLPDAQAQFRRPLAGAFAEFLGGLPAEYQASVLAAQASLPPTASAAERLAALARSCPVLHKLGQVLARDRRLSPNLRQHLRELESLPVSVPFETLQDTLTQELGPLERHGVRLVSPALAEASVAVVVPFEYDHDSEKRTPRGGVFKLLKPGIEERLELELALFVRVGSYLDQRCDDFRIPHLDYRDVFEQVRDKLRHEVRLDLEQRHLVQARSVYESEPRVQIPALLHPCTPRVTAMERVVGGKVSEHGMDSESGQRRLADLVVQALIAGPIFSRASLALFHGDPHAGNLLWTMDHRLAVLDWSLVGLLGERERIAMMQILLGVLAYRPEQIVTALELLAQRRVDRSALDLLVRNSLAALRRGQFPGFTWLMGLLDETVQTARLSVATDLLLFRKALHILEGVVADIAPTDGPMDRVLLREFFRHFAMEWPRRWLALPHSHAFATRISNADLVHCALTIPWAATQIWAEYVQDLQSVSGCL